MPSLVDLFHMLAFKNMDKKRDRHISAASSKKIKSNFKINNMAEKLHPGDMLTVVKEVIPSGKDCILVTLERTDSGAFPVFRAGQYIDLIFHDKENCFSRPYSICSSPKEAQNGILRIMVKKVPGGIATGKLFDYIEPDKQLWINGPHGEFTHDDCRDSEYVIALAGGSGITPFLSMANAIADGDENFSMTILYGARDRDSMCLYEEVKRVTDTEDRVKLVPILSEEERIGFESGFITAELIEKHIPLDLDGGKAEVSVYVCGPEAMYRAMEPILMGMGFDKKHVRFECSPGEKPERPEGVVNITVKRAGETFTIYGRKDETIVMSLEKADVLTAARCRSGSCGFCRGRVISGEVTTPPELTDQSRLNHNGFDHRRAVDKEMGVVHLCVTYPDTDVVIEIAEHLMVPGQVG